MSLVLYLIYDRDDFMRRKLSALQARLRALGSYAAQELFELALKAGIRELGMDYPKVHDLAAGFVAAAAAAGVSLSTMEARGLMEDSKWLADNRGPAFYLERSYTAEEAGRAADAAERALELVEERVFRQPR